MWWRCPRRGRRSKFGEELRDTRPRSVEVSKYLLTPWSRGERRVRRKAVIFFSRGAFGPLCADGVGVICQHVRLVKSCYITLLEDNSARQPLRRDYTAHTPASFAPGPGSLSSRSGTLAPRRPARNHLYTQTTLCIPHPSSTEEGICAMAPRGIYGRSKQVGARRAGGEAPRSMSGLSERRSVRRCDPVDVPA